MFKLRHFDQTPRTNLTQKEKKIEKKNQEQIS